MPFDKRRCAIGIVVEQKRQTGKLGSKMIGRHDATVRSLVSGRAVFVVELEGKTIHHEQRSFFPSLLALELRLAYRYERCRGMSEQPSVVSSQRRKQG